MTPAKKKVTHLIPDVSPVHYHDKDYYAPILTHTSKMPCHSFSMTAGESCPFADFTRKDAICKKCYAKKYKRFKLAYAYQGIRFQWVRDCMKTPEGRAQFVALVVEAIRDTGDVFFRGHDSGDFFNAVYVQCWIEICSQLPDVRFWFPTRSYQTGRDFNPLLPVFNPILHLLQKLHALENVTVKPSALAVGDDTPRIPGLGAGSGVNSTNADVIACEAYTRDGHCGDCRMCWEKGTAITYPLH
jgi:hypothetical protein